MDLSKTSDTVNHSLLLAKLDVYGFSRTSLKLIQNYLCNRQQRSFINGSFSDWSEVITGVKVPLWVRFCLIYFSVYFEMEAL